MDHEQVSARLRDHVLGRLDATSARAVEDHLEACDGCTGEHAALRALLVGEDAGMDDLERRRLRASVKESLRHEAPRPASARRGWRSRLVPAMGAAALLVVVAVVAISVGGDDLGDRGPAGLAISAIPSDRPAGGRAQEAKPAPGPDAAESPEPLEDASEGGRDDGDEPAPSTETASAGKAEPPVFETIAANLDETDLVHFGRKRLRNARSGRFSESYRFKGRFLTRLSLEAPGRVRRQIRRCARVARTEEDLIPAYGAVADYNDRRALILAFLFPPREDDSPRFSLWAWPRGSCKRPLAVKTGALRP